MIGIKAISTYLPESRINNLDRAEKLGSSSDQVKNRIGFKKIAQLGNDENTLSLAYAALSKLINTQKIQPESIEVLVVVSQNPDRNIPHLSAELHGQAGLSKTCACFDVGLGCSGYVYGLSVIQAFMTANNMSKGVLVTADPYSRIVDQTDKATALIFGDGATATLIETEPVYSLGITKFGTYGADAEKLKNDDGVLYMNGRAVFNFAATHVPKHIEEVVQSNDLILENIDYYLVHQGSLYIVQTIADRLKVSRSVVPFHAAEYGNTISSSIPFMLSELLDRNDLKNIVLSGFGLGLSWASTVIKREG